MKLLIKLPEQQYSKAQQMLVAFTSTKSLVSALGAPVSCSTQCQCSVLQFQHFAEKRFKYISPCLSVKAIFLFKINHQDF
jgi:hypothetical protein